MTADEQFCLAILPRVSRTFAPAIRMLPKGLQLPVSIAYLLCRIADTIEDSQALTLTQKREMLDLYVRIFTGPRQESLLDFQQRSTSLPRTCADEVLVHDLDRVIRVFNSFSDTVQKHIAFWVIEMSKGMHKYAQSLKMRHLHFLKTMKELDEYTYYVAGTVGYLLTELFSYYSQTITPQLQEKLEQCAGSFGTGLQLVNIIRDMALDFKRGQSYIPDELLEKYQLDRTSIFELQNSERVDKLFHELIFKAVKHLDQALVYVLLIPKKEKRIRLFCMLPLFWAMRTLQKIQSNTLALVGYDKIKISRRIIRKEFLLAFIHNHSNWLMQKYYLSIRKHCTRPASLYPEKQLE
ncbi:squalene/phytoene synthase family protein [bacterium]|nr:squalene/phytoene synthase family protein [bacterium]